jgi:hypothetical protein
MTGFGLLPHNRSMKMARTIRCALTLLSAVAMFALVPALPAAQSGHGGGRSQMQSPRMPGAQHPGQNKEHLPQWLARHSDMPLAQQQKALESEPGFHDLPSETQQRLRDRLTQLNNMPPEQRQRLLERNEAVANMAPAQRQQFRGAMDQFRSLTPDRRKMVARAFRDLREMPEPQRQAMLSSDRFKDQFTDQERGALSNLLAVEPYIPGSKAGDSNDLGR